MHPVAMLRSVASLASAVEHIEAQEGVCVLPPPTCSLQVLFHEPTGHRLELLACHGLHRHMLADVLGQGDPQLPLTRKYCLVDPAHLGL